MAPDGRQPAKFKKFEVRGPKERLIQAPSFTDKAVQRIIEGRAAAMRKAIAIDFDGCLCVNEWPGIGAPNLAAIQAALEEQRKGTALILWTCRSGDRLTEAVEWCKGHGLEFDAINENLQERLEYYGCESRKVSADEYWDDRSVLVTATTERSEQHG